MTRCWTPAPIMTRQRLPRLSSPAADGYAKAVPVKVRCPICVVPGPGPLFGEFTAMSDEQLFAMIANHVMGSHNGGGADAFDTAERVLPRIGQRWRERVAADPDSYRS
jgi:hypothetical protein